MNDENQSKALEEVTSDDTALVPEQADEAVEIEAKEVSETAEVAEEKSDVAEVAEEEKTETTDATEDEKEAVEDEKATQTADATEDEKPEAAEVAEEEKSETAEVVEEEKTELAEVAADEEKADGQSEAVADGEKTEKVKKPNKFAEWIKSHKLITAIVCSVIVIAAGLTIGHFVATKDMVFVKDAVALAEAVAENKGEKLVIKNDITVEGDLTLGKAYEIDLKGNTLTVNGTLTINGSDSDEINCVVSTAGKPKKLTEGNLIADTLCLNGLATNYDFKSTLTATRIISVAKSVIFGTLYSDSLYMTSNVNFDGTALARSTGALIVLEIKNGSKVTVNGNVDGAFALDATVNMVVSDNCKINSVFGGNEVRLYDGAQAEQIMASAKPVIAPTAVVGKFINCTPILQEKLNAPIAVTVTNHDGDLVVSVTEVNNAEKYEYKIDGGDVKVSDGAVIVLPSQIPGQHYIEIRAINSNEKYISSDWAYQSFSFAVKLSTPQLSIQTRDSENKEVAWLIINDVNNADFYKVTISSKAGVTELENKLADTMDLPVSVDIASYVQGVGDYSITVQSCSNASYYGSSDLAQITYTTTKMLGEVVFDDTTWAEDFAEDILAGETSVISWTAVENANYYQVKVESISADPTVVSTVLYSTTVTATETAITLPETGVYGVDYKITVVALPHDYYTAFVPAE